MIDKSDNNEIDDPVLQPDKKRKVPGAKRAAFALFIASLALFFTAAGIAAGYKHWQRMSDRAKGNARKIEAIETALPAKVDGQTLSELNAEMSQRINDHQKTAERQLHDMARMQTQTRQFAETVTAQIEQITALQTQLKQEAGPESGQEWQLAEVAFLLRLAIRESDLTGNHQTAHDALKAADQRLSEIGGVNYLSVRQQIARDITVLEAIAEVDMTALSAKIDNLLYGLRPAVTAKQLMVSKDTASAEVLSRQGVAKVTTETANDAVGGSGEDSLWSGYKSQAMDAINQVIIVRQVDKPLVSTLSADAQQHLYQLLQLRLENLRLLALQKNHDAYQAQVILLRDTLKHYYAVESVTEWLATLDELAAVNLRPERPDISGSLRQLEQVRQLNMAKGR
ncbi:MAG: uroporphyrinogen-III C-methyltransferase [Thiolinea sp.]